ncbi:MAG: metallophosphoesterase [Thermoplasmata archaeon]
MRVRPVHGERALELEYGGSRHVVIADLHIGIEDELASKGVRIPDQTGRALERALALVERLGPASVILLGDVRHRIPLARNREARRVRHFLECLARRVPVTLVLGNHDAGLRSIAPPEVEFARALMLGSSDSRMGAPAASSGRVRRERAASPGLRPVPAPRVALAGGRTASSIIDLGSRPRYRQGKTTQTLVGLFHGHARPPPEFGACGTFVVAHTHPSLLLTDESGRTVTEPCWLRAPPTPEGRKRYPMLSKVIVMPAFSDLRSGVAVNAPGARLLGPLFRAALVDVARARANLIDGTYLGTVADLLERSGAAAVEGTGVAD